MSSVKHSLPAHEDYPLYLPPPRHRTNPASTLIAAVMLIGMIGIILFGASLLRYGPSLYRAPVEMHDAPVNVYVNIDNGQNQPAGETATVDPGVFPTAQPPPAQIGKYRTQQTFHRGENGSWETTDPYSQSDDWRVLTWSDSLYIPENRQDGRDPELCDMVDIKYDPENPTPEHTFVYYFSESADSLVQYSEAESERLFADDVDKGYLSLEALSPQAKALYYAIKGGT